MGVGVGGGSLNSLIRESPEYKYENQVYPKKKKTIQCVELTSPNKIFWKKEYKPTQKTQYKAKSIKYKANPTKPTKPFHRHS